MSVASCPPVQWKRFDTADGSVYRLGMTQPKAIAELPDAPPDAVRILYAALLEADDEGASSNDWTQIIDDWFTAQGFPTILYRGQR